MRQPSNASSVFLLFLVFLTSCATTLPEPTAYQRTGEVKCLVHDNATISMHVKAMGSTPSEAQHYADIKAFDNIFYKGIPNSNQEVPMIEEERRTPENDAFVQNFYHTSKHREYITESSVLKMSEHQGSTFVDQKVTVHLSALRRYLEENDVIRKFGL